MTLKLKSSSEGDFSVKRSVSSRRIRRRKRRAKRILDSCTSVGLTGIVRVGPIHPQKFAYKKQRSAAHFCAPQIEFCCSSSTIYTHTSYIYLV